MQITKAEISTADTVFNKWFKFEYISNYHTFVQHETCLFIYICISTEYDCACLLGFFLGINLTGEIVLISMLALLKTTLDVKWKHSCLVINKQNQGQNEGNK